MSVVLKAAAAIAAICAALGALPFLAAGGDASGPISPYACGPLAVILDTIRSLESGGNYQVTITTSSASGAYALIDSSWRHYAALAGVDTDRYPRAYLAPEPDQDAAATVYVTEILDGYNDDVTVIPVAWYLPSAIHNPAKMDVVPAIGGNVLTPREYQAKWLAVYDDKLAARDDTANPADCVTGTAGPRGPISADGRWALPAPYDTIKPGTLDDPHHDYPAWAFLIPQGTPIYAITYGVVVTTQHWNGNWWRAGCGHAGAPATCNTCGNGLTIQTADGLRHTYCHNQRLHVNDGDRIVAGQHIADSGNTGRSGSPHLHLELRLNGRQHCPQPLLAAVYQHTPIPAPSTLPEAGCTF
jgi:murein DD-endopeptidase MepM/ murein hydrolase activator NlpD